MKTKRSTKTPSVLTKLVKALGMVVAEQDQLRNELLLLVKQQKSSAAEIQAAISFMHNLSSTLYTELDKSKSAASHGETVEQATLAVEEAQKASEPAAAEYLFADRYARFEEYDASEGFKASVASTPILDPTDVQSGDGSQLAITNVSDGPSKAWVLFQSYYAQGYKSYLVPDAALAAIIHDVHYQDEAYCDYVRLITYTLRQPVGNSELWMSQSSAV